MKVAVFSTKPYDQEYFEQYRKSHNFAFTYFETPLNCDTANLTSGFDALCVFVNDKVDNDTIKRKEKHVTRKQ